MSSSVLLSVGVGGIALAILVVAVAFMPKRPQQPSISRALATIENRYSRDASAGSGKKEPLKLPDWLERLAVRLSPAGVATVMQRRLDVAGNPGGWSTDRMLAVKGLGLVALGLLGALYGLRNPALLVVGAG